MKQIFTSLAIISLLCFSQGVFAQTEGKLHVVDDKTLINNAHYDKHGFVPGQKVKYVSNANKKMRATILERVSDDRYLLLIDKGNKKVKKKVSAGKIEHVD